jgi:hypothetical protein
MIAVIRSAVLAATLAAAAADASASLAHDRLSRQAAERYQWTY